MNAMQQVTQGHLGGYVEGEHGDEATWYPELWQWFIDRMHVTSMIDVGCGTGVTVKFFQKLGVKAHGVDGLAKGAWIVPHDYTLGSYMPDPVDLIWCCEFVEHVQEQYMVNFLQTFKSAKIVALTHAEPGQAGHHHVNCKTSQYWIGAMAAIGYKFDDIFTKIARIAARINPSPWNHFVRAGLIFIRNGENIKAYPRV